MDKRLYGDIHFIETSEKYPSEYDSSDNNDLDVYVNKENRENARPELATHVENMDDYDVVFLGFPNWYGDMPMEKFVPLGCRTGILRNWKIFCHRLPLLLL